MECATSKSSDQPAHTRSLIRAFASRRYSKTVKLLTEHNLDLLSLKEGCTGSSESTLVKMPHCWKSHVTAHIASEKLARDRGLLVLPYSMVIITFTQRVLVLGNLSEL